VETAATTTRCIGKRPRASTGSLAFGHRLRWEASGLVRQMPWQVLKPSQLTGYVRKARHG
jgi:hypothetical protein